VLGELLGMAGDDMIGDLVGTFGLQLVAVTRGDRGAVLYAADGTVAEHSGYSAEPLADTVGAGDAFTAVLAMGLLRGAPLARIADAACRVARYVCTRAGATPELPWELLGALGDGGTW